MSQNDLFTNEFESRSPGARGVAYVLIGVGALISASATAAFFHAFAADLFGFISPEMSPWLAAAAGVFLFEWAAFAWAQVEARHADTSEQIAIAAAGKWLALAGSILTTVVFFSLRSSLLAGRLDETAMFVVSIIGGLLVIIGSSGLFLLIALYVGASSSHTKARNNAAIRAMRASAEHTINRETTAATLAQTIESIRRGLPENTQRQGQLNANQFVSERFTQEEPPAKRNWQPRQRVGVSSNGRSTDPKD